VIKVYSRTPVITNMDLEQQVLGLADAFPPGAIIAGRYRLDGVLGIGGYGVVHAAAEVHDGRRVALKLLLPRLAASEKTAARFRREARIAGALEHPNTVRLCDHGQTEQGVPFTAWELLAGRSLRQALDDDGPFPARRVIHVAVQVLGSLAEAHDRGILHRDIKPENIFLVEREGDADFVKVLDFGIARPLPGSELDGTRITGASTLIGTPSYMARELITETEPGPFTDIYALGLVMAELLTGTRVFDADLVMEVLRDQLADEPPPLTDAVLRSPLGSIIVRATSKDAAARYQTAGEMREHCEGVLSDPAWTAPGYTEGAPRRAMPPVRLVSGPNIGAAVPVSPPVAASGERVVPERAPATVKRAGSPRPHGRLFASVIALALLLVVLAVVATWMVSRWLATRPFERAEPATVAVAHVPGDTEEPGPVVRPPASAPEPEPPPLDVATVRHRIVQAGWTVEREAEDPSHPDMVFHNFIVRQGAETATVNVYLYHELDKAVAGERMMHSMSRPVARRGLVLVYVFRQANDQTAWTLLRLIMS